MINQRGVTLVFTAFMIIAGYELRFILSNFKYQNSHG